MPCSEHSDILAAGGLEDILSHLISVLQLTKGLYLGFSFGSTYQPVPSALVRPSIVEIHGGNKDPVSAAGNTGHHLNMATKSTNVALPHSGFLALYQYYLG